MKVLSIKLNWKIPTSSVGSGIKTKTIFCGSGMDIFWNKTQLI